MSTMRDTASRMLPLGAMVALLAHPAEAQELRGGAGSWLIRAEGAAGMVLADLPRNASQPATRALGLGLTAGYALHDLVTAQIAARLAALPDRDGARPTATSVGAGLRVSPRIGATARAYLEVGLGLAFLSETRRFSADVGLGVDFAVNAHLSLGPVLRYTHIVQPDRLYDRPNEHPTDPRWLTLGLAVTLGTRAPARAPVAPDPSPLRALADLDHDGVLDADDRCVVVPAGDRPDPDRPGCPLPDPDRDRDGVPEPDDRCPDAASGPNPDPDRPGCPAADADNDGVFDHLDPCPVTPPGAHPDPDRPGCPRSALASLGDIAALVGPIAPIPFSPGSDRLVGRTTFEGLDRLAARLLLLSPAARILIDGHADPTEDPGISTLRAARVREYLGRRGLDRERLVHRGLGSSRQVPDGAGTEGRALQRRVTIRVVPEGSSPP